MESVTHFPLQFFGQKLAIRSFLAAREDGKFHFYLGDQVFSYETEGKSDEGGQLVSPGMLPSRSLESAGGRKAYGQISTFHPQMVQTLRWKFTGEGGLGPKLKRELQYLPQMIVTGLTATQECRAKQGGRRWSGFQGHPTEPALPLGFSVTTKAEF